MGTTPESNAFMAAAKIGDIERLEHLLANNDVHGINEGDKDWRTTLMLAAENGHVECVKCLLNTGKVDINKEDILGKTALMLATENGHVECVKCLQDTGKVDVNKEDALGRTALMLAARNGHVECVNFFLDTATVDDINKRRDTYGRTVFMSAALYGHVECVKYLLDTGKVDDINQEDKKGSTALMLAVWNGHVECVKYLLDTGKIVDMNKKDHFGITAFMLAAYRGHPECLRCFFDIAVTNGIPTRDASQDISPTSFFTPNESTSSFTYVPSITWKSPYIYDRDQEGQCILKLVVGSGLERCLTCFLLGDLDIRVSQHSVCHHDRLEHSPLNISDNMNSTALMLAASSRREKCVDYILQYERIRFHTLVIFLRDKFVRTNQISFNLYKKLCSLIWGSDQVDCFLRMMCDGIHPGKCVDFLLSVFICQTNENRKSALGIAANVVDAPIGFSTNHDSLELLLQHVQKPERSPLLYSLKQIFVDLPSPEDDPNAISNFNIHLHKFQNAFLSNGIFHWSWYPDLPIERQNLLARALVTAGYSPGQFEWRGMPSSPLHHAFMTGNEGLVRYLVVNLYLTSRDMCHSPTDTDLRDHVLRNGPASLQNLYRQIYYRPWCLKNLSLVKVSTHLTCKVRKVNMTPIDALQIPPVYKRWLSFKSAQAEFIVTKWNSIDINL